MKGVDDPIECCNYLFVCCQVELVSKRIIVLVVVLILCFGLQIYLLFIVIVVLALFQLLVRKYRGTSRFETRHFVLYKRLRLSFLARRLNVYYHRHWYLKALISKRLPIFLLLLIYRRH